MSSSKNAFTCVAPLHTGFHSWSYSFTNGNSKYRKSSIHTADPSGGRNVWSVDPWFHGTRPVGAKTAGGYSSNTYIFMYSNAGPRFECSVSAKTWVTFTEYDVNIPHGLAGRHNGKSGDCSLVSHSHSCAFGILFG